MKKKLTFIHYLLNSFFITFLYLFIIEGNTKETQIIKIDNKLLQVRPIYPPKALSARVEGHVILNFKIKEDKPSIFKVHSIEIVESNPEKIFDDSALYIANKYRLPDSIIMKEDQVYQTKITYQLPPELLPKELKQLSKENVFAEIDKLSNKKIPLLLSQGLEIKSTSSWDTQDNMYLSVYEDNIGEYSTYSGWNINADNIHKNENFFEIESQDILESIHTQTKQTPGLFNQFYVLNRNSKPATLLNTRFIQDLSKLYEKFYIQLSLNVDKFGNVTKYNILENPYSVSPAIISEVINDLEISPAMVNRRSMKDQLLIKGEIAIIDKFILRALAFNKYSKLKSSGWCRFTLLINQDGSVKESKHLTKSEDLKKCDLNLLQKTLKYKPSLSIGQTILFLKSD